jgi:2-polyprenyl-3-methyl-5-hydroxy-6-metoxy-1,4-benzoquinol methylase
MTHLPTSPFAVWKAGLRIGIASASREPVLGLKRIVLPVSYWRAAEFSYVGRQLTVGPGARLLDLGSPKDLAAILARRGGFEVVSTDILDEEVESSRRYAAAQGLYGDGPGRVTAQIQDGRQLKFPDDSFDAVFSVSVLEHIPEDGDSRTIRELVRVVKPGGLVIVTTPYDEQYRETFVDQPVYERGYRGEPVFFERHYDPASLKSRLLDPSGAQVVNLEIWGEAGMRIESMMARLGKGRAFLSPAEAFLSAAFLRRLPEGKGHPMAAFFTLRKNLV